MKLKSITFRCADAQYTRLHEALGSDSANRTDLICNALDSFLRFAEQPEIRKLDLFALVQAVEEGGDGTPFADQI
ncbi:MAG: hypothetical protein ACI4O9_01625 [Akkermansia sp.]